MSSFHLKRALVTGAGKGIGRAIALELAHKGTEVHAISRTQLDLDNLRKECPDITVHNIDVADWDKTRSTVKSIGAVDFLVNNAAIYLEVPFLDLNKKQLDSLFDINFKSVINISQMVARQMVENNRGGSIVNMSSTGGFKVAPNMCLYCTSKAALDMLTKSMAIELGPHNIRVNSINPGLLSTNMTKNTSIGTAEFQKLYSDITPLRGLVRLQDVVNATMFLLSDQSSMVTGNIFPVDGGSKDVILA